MAIAGRDPRLVAFDPDATARAQSLLWSLLSLGAHPDRVGIVDPEDGAISLQWYTPTGGMVNIRILPGEDRMRDTIWIEDSAPAERDGGER